MMCQAAGGPGRDTNRIRQEQVPRALPPHQPYSFLPVELWVHMMQFCM